MSEQRFDVIIDEKDEDGNDMPDGRSRLLVFRDGKKVAEHWDGGEPEDQFFFRDWSWVPSALEQAYKWGQEDGK